MYVPGDELSPEGMYWDFYAFLSFNKGHEDTWKMIVTGTFIKEGELAQDQGLQSPNLQHLNSV